MSNDIENKLEARYQNHFGRIAGYLPQDRQYVDEWQRSLKKQIEDARASNKIEDSPAVNDLEALIKKNGIVRMYVEQMIEQVPEPHQTIKNVEELLDALRLIVKSAPSYNPNPSKRNFFPMSSLFVYMMMTPAGEAVFRNKEFNDAIRKILTEWCKYLDSADSKSVLNTDEDGWLSESAYEYNRLIEFVIPDPSAPHWGWKSYNDFFHREIKPEFRPIADPGNPKVIVSANDGTAYKIARDVKAIDKFWIKGQPYSLVNMLNNSKYIDRFVGGDVFQSFLSGANYHRWRSPIDGVVQPAQVVDGLMFSDAESAGEDPTAGTYSQGYEASVNTRGLVFIESDDPIIGMVCVIPIGITEISSVTLRVKNGDKVNKGDELGYFSYGGSSMCLVFQRGAIANFTVEEGTDIFVNARIALAK